MPVVDLDPVTICLAWRQAAPPANLAEIRDVVRTLRADSSDADD